jgi:hypothetical protein
MTATAPAPIEFMKSAGLPLTTESRKTYTEVREGIRLAYLSLAVFIPGIEPYEFATLVEFFPRAQSVAGRHHWSAGPGGKVKIGIGVECGFLDCARWRSPS